MITIKEIDHSINNCNYVIEYNEFCNGLMTIEFPHLEGKFCSLKDYIEKISNQKISYINRYDDKTLLLILVNKVTVTTLNKIKEIFNTDYYVSTDNSRSAVRLQIPVNII